jgi:hypothetical protein
VNSQSRIWHKGHVENLQAVPAGQGPIDAAQPEELAAETHLAYFVSEVVDELDLTGINGREPTSTFSM